MQQKTWSNDVCLLRYGTWHNFLSFQVIYCSFTPLLTWKIKIWKNVKNTLRYYPFTYVHHKSRSYNVWFLIYKVERTKFFVILDHFVCPLTLLTTQKTKILKKIKKYLEILSFYTCVPQMTIKMHGVWYIIKHDRQNFLSFWTIFALLPS